MNLEPGLKSKLQDGYLVALAMFLLNSLLMMIESPVQQLLGRPGLLVYTLLLMALSVFVLERTLSVSTSVISSLRSGMLGGLLGWTAVYLSGRVGNMNISDESSLLLMIFVSLIGVTLWLKILPVGGKAFLTVFQLSWADNLLMGALDALVLKSPGFIVVQQGLLIVSLAGLVAFGVWTALRSITRDQRLWAGLWMWLFATNAAALAYALWG